MAGQGTYEQRMGRMVVAHALQTPGTDVAWPLMFGMDTGVWMTDAVEWAATEMRVPQCDETFSLEGGT